VLRGGECVSDPVEERAIVAAEKHRSGVTKHPLRGHGTSRQAPWTGRQSLRTMGLRVWRQGQFYEGFRYAALIRRSNRSDPSLTAGFRNGRSSDGDKTPRRTRPTPRTP